MSIIESIRSRFQQRTAEGIEAVVASARDVAAGKNADPVAVESALVNAGVDVAEGPALIDSVN